MAHTILGYDLGSYSVKLALLQPREEDRGPVGHQHHQEDTRQEEDSGQEVHPTSQRLTGVSLQGVTPRED